MLGAIRNGKRSIIATLLIAGSLSFVSCATEKKQVSVVDDPDKKTETAIPWNEQQKWEQGQEMGGLAQGTDRAH